MIGGDNDNDENVEKERGIEKCESCKNLREKYGQKKLYKYNVLHIDSTYKKGCFLKLCKNHTKIKSKYMTYFNNKSLIFLLLQEKKCQF